MTITSGLVLYAVSWFMVLFMALPFGVKNQEEAGEVEPGTSAGAPNEPLLRKKMIWTTIISAVVWIIAFLVIESGVVTAADITRVFGRSES